MARSGQQRPSGTGARLPSAQFSSKHATLVQSTSSSSSSSCSTSCFHSSRMENSELKLYVMWKNIGKNISYNFHSISFQKIFALEHKNIFSYSQIHFLPPFYRHHLPQTEIRRLAAETRHETFKMLEFMLGTLFGIFLCYAYGTFLSTLGVLLMLALIIYYRSYNRPVEVHVHE